MRPIDPRKVKSLLAKRGERGWTVAEFAQSIGYSRQTVHNAIFGHSAYPKILQRIADGLEVPLSRILIAPAKPDDSIKKKAA